jgi:hypothetical protein
MEVILILAIAVVLGVLAVVAMSPFSRRAGDKVDETARAIAPAADQSREFRRPPDQDEPPPNP